MDPTTGDTATEGLKAAEVREAGHVESATQQLEGQLDRLVHQVDRIESVTDRVQRHDLPTAAVLQTSESEVLPGSQLARNLYEKAARIGALADRLGILADHVDL